MKRLICFFLFASLFLLPEAKQVAVKAKGYPISPVPFTAVKVNDSFWSPRLEASRNVTIPLAFDQCEKTGHISRFYLAAHPSAANAKNHGSVWDDSDLYKVIEGAAYSLHTFPNKKLENYIDSIINLIAGAQEPDGYLYAYRTMAPKNVDWISEKRWESVEHGSHELYNLGHLMEGAVAYYQATGKRKLLDVAIKAADCICRSIGPGKDQLKVVPGHEEVELALCKLYLVTGNEKYLRQAQFFIDMRGRTESREENIQCNIPVDQQKTATGHAVRAGYLYSGMADVASLTGNQSYINILDTIWNDLISYRYYLNGGVGANAGNEGFGKKYELGNETAYNETCASIALALFNQRLFLFHGDSKYIDVLERTLYNGLLDGVSIQGDRFFYPNPLASHGKYGRSKWFGCACCPSNVCRFIPSVPGYIYAVQDKKVYVNLFLSNQSTLNVDSRPVVLSQSTKYPWNGDVNIKIDKNAAGEFDLAIRIPGWVQNKPVPSLLYTYCDGLNAGYTVQVNGEKVESSLQKGYFVIHRKWKKGDRVSVHFDMPVRMVKADNNVEADRGMIAVERGPLLYCAEGVDNPEGVFTLVMPKAPQFQVVNCPDVLGGITEITAPVQHLSQNANTGLIETSSTTLTLIPYYSWDHRGVDQMKVWLPQGIKEIEVGQ
jgi:DUF1680 family protein